MQVIKAVLRAQAHAPYLVVQVGAQDGGLALGHELELVNLRLRFPLSVNRQVQLPLQLSALGLRVVEEEEGGGGDRGGQKRKVLRAAREMVKAKEE